LKAPFKGTLAVPSGTSAWTGCIVLKSAVPRFQPNAGLVLESVSASAHTCKAAGGLGGGGGGFEYSGVSVEIPFKVGTAGRHSVGANWTLTLSSTVLSTQGGCPAKKVNYHPSLFHSSSADCYSQGSLYLQLSVSVVDLNNRSWWGNASDEVATNNSYWENSTTCYNSGTPTCTNVTRGASYARAVGTQAPGFSAFAWNGPTTFTTWTNGTNMSPTHHYELLFSLAVLVSASAQGINLAGSWPAVGVASANLASSGHGARLNSVTIL
jgi:hypothetical protein